MWEIRLFPSDAFEDISEMSLARESAQGLRGIVGKHFYVCALFDQVQNGVNLLCLDRPGQGRLAFTIRYIDIPASLSFAGCAHLSGMRAPSEAAPPAADPAPSEQRL